MQYDFKLVEEMVWAGLVAAAVFALTALANFADPMDWRAFLVAVGGGSVRAAAGAVLAVLTRRRSQ